MVRLENGPLQQAWTLPVRRLSTAAIFRTSTRRIRMIKAVIERVVATLALALATIAAVIALSFAIYSALKLWCPLGEAAA